MSNDEMQIVNGPDKPGLQWSLTKPGESMVHFTVEGDVLEAQIDRMDELSDGFTFALLGHLTSGEMNGRPFEGVYNIGSRSGWIRVVNSARPEWPADGVR
jgi:hypothetical protein